MFSRLQALFTANRKSPRRVSTYRSLAIESLETREVMAAQVISAVLNAEGVLRVDGTKKADMIVVRQDGGQISVAGVKINTSAGLQSQVAASAVRKIEVFGGNGNDVIRLDQGTQAITAAAMLDGGKGNDKYAGGAGLDTLVIGAKEKDGLLTHDAVDQLAFAQADGVRKSVVRSTDNAIVTLRAGNKVFVNGAQARTNAADFAVTGEGRLFVLSTKGALETQVGNKWVKIATDAVKIALGSDAVYSLSRDGWLQVDGGNMWPYTKDFAMAADGTLYRLDIDGRLESLAPGSGQYFADVASNVESFTLNADGTLSIVYGQGTTPDPDPIPDPTPGPGRIDATADLSIFFRDSANGFFQDEYIRNNGTKSIQVVAGWVKHEFGRIVDQGQFATITLTAGQEAKLGPLNDFGGITYRYSVMSAYYA